jgi:hypothetical protein
MDPGTPRWRVKQIMPSREPRWRDRNAERETDRSRAFRKTRRSLPNRTCFLFLASDCVEGRTREGVDDFVGDAGTAVAAGSDLK